MPSNPNLMRTKDHRGNEVGRRKSGREGTEATEDGKNGQGSEREILEEGSEGEGLNPRGKASDVDSRCEANHKAVKGRAAELSTEAGDGPKGRARKGASGRETNRGKTEGRAKAGDQSEERT